MSFSFCRHHICIIVVFSMTLCACGDTDGSESDSVPTVPSESAESSEEQQQTSNSSEKDETNTSDCKDEFSVAQGPSEPCCPEYGVDACGAELVCAALDGRTQPVCYGRGTRFDGEECTKDALCYESSVCDGGKCVDEELAGKSETCRTYLNSVCDKEMEFRLEFSSCETRLEQARQKGCGDNFKDVISCMDSRCYDQGRGRGGEVRSGCGDLIVAYNECMGNG